MVSIGAHMILAINTSTAHTGLALLREDGTVLGEYSVSAGSRHFGNLMPALHFLMFSSKSDIHELTGLVVARGPGSFTGLRVGLSAAKGLCHALDLPVVGVSSLEALASQVPYSSLPVMPVIDSRKGEFFTARFIWSNDQGLLRNSEDVYLKLEDFPALCKEPTLLIGNDFEGQGAPLRGILGSSVLPAPAHLWNLRASAVGFLGLKRLQSKDFDDPRSLDPVYMRPPDIRPNLFPPAQEVEICC